MPCESSIIVTTPSRKRSSCAAITLNRSWSGAASPRMLKMPSKMTTTRPMPSGTARSFCSRSSALLCLKIDRRSPGTLAMRIARMMQLWFSSSPIQNVSGPDSVMAVPRMVV